MGMAWGAVSVLAGAALLASMVTFDVREIGWNYLNKSGEVMEGTTNLLNVVGLYGAGIVYWVLGGICLLYTSFPSMRMNGLTLP